MGLRPMMVRKFAKVAGTSSPRSIMLQWDRAFDCAEIKLPEDAEQVAAGASMGPRL